MRFLSTLRGKAATFAGAAGAMLAAGAAMAQEDGLSGAVTAELASGKTQMYAVGAAILTLTAVVVLIRHIRKSAN